MNILQPWYVIRKTLQIWWEGWLGLLLFGVVWVLCWATLVLGPPATFGFFYAVRWWMVEREIRWEHYYNMAKKHLLTSWGWFLTTLFVLFLVYANYVFYGNLGSGLWSFLQVIALIVGFIWVAIQFYALPYYVLLEKKSLFTAWKNGLFTILASPLFSLVIWIAAGVLLFLHLMIFPVLIGGPSLLVLLASIAVENRIEKFGIRERDANRGGV